MQTKRVFMLVTTQYLRYEGIEHVLTNLKEKAGIENIVFHPRIFEETGDHHDLRLPPLDLDGSDRLLERPLWGGKKELYGKFYLPYEIDTSLYEESPYTPAYRSDIDDPIARTFTIARREGMQTHVALSLMKLAGGLQPEDYPMMPGGEKRLPAVSFKACVNNPRARAYGRALLLDTVNHYQPDGVFLDWLEYTNYYFEDNLLCFCEGCQKQADTFGFDFHAMREAASSVLTWVKHAGSSEISPGNDWNATWERMSPGIGEFFRFKAHSVKDYIAILRRELDAAGFDIPLFINGFAMPMNIGSGTDYHAQSEMGNNILSLTKLYRFHWGLMVGWYAKALAQLNGRIPAAEWLSFVLNMLELDDDVEGGMDHYRMPAPDERGPLTLENETRKLDQALEQTASKDRLMPIVHGYCPREVFRQRLRTAAASQAEAIFIQRYGYTNDEKLRDIGQLIKGL